MKRLLFFGLIALSFTTFSCRKQRYCVCTDGTDTFTESVGMTTKRQAENRCDLLTAGYYGIYTCTAQ
jgi:hypothetical protein